jgi:hypothetical protein
MRLTWLATLLAVGLIGQAEAQNYVRVTNCGDWKPPSGSAQGSVDQNGLVCVGSSGAGGAVTIQGSSTPSPGNSTTTPLAGGATFTGTAVDISTFSQVQVYVKSDQASAVGGVQLEFSPDGTTWGDTSIYDFTPGSGNNLDQSYNAGSRAKFFRFVYTNGATPQGSVLISTLLRGQNALGDFVDMSIAPSQFGHGQVTSSVISGTGGKGPVLLKANAQGKLTGAVTPVTLAIKTVTTGGVAVTSIAAGARTEGCFLQNPPSATVNLCINEIGTAAGTTSSGDTVCIVPGATYVVSAGPGAVSVISSDSAHPFAGYGYQ